MIGRLRSLNRVELRRFVSAFSSRFSSTILSFVVLFAASRLLPVREYGLYVFLFSIGSALGLIAVLGQQILVVKHYRRDRPAADPLNRALIRVNMEWLALGIGVLLVSALVLWWIGPQLPETYDHLYVACIFAAAFAASEYLQNYFRIHGRINLSLIPREIAWRGASALCLVGVGLAGLLFGGVETILIVTALLVVATGYQVLAFTRQEGTGWLRPAHAADRVLRRPWQIESGYFIANNVLNSCSSYLETIVIGAALGLDKAAFYFVALRIAMLLTLPVSAIDTVGIPMIAARFQAGDTPGAQRLIGRLSFGSFCISLAGALVMAGLGRFALGLFNPEFSQHADVLLLLCFLAVSQAFFGPGSWLLMIGGGERYFLLTRLGLFAAYLGLLYGLASAAGLIGIALAGILFNVASNLAATLWVMEHWGIDNMATALFRPILLRRRASGGLPLRAEKSSA